MSKTDRTSKLIQYRSLALGNHLVFQFVVPGLFIVQTDLTQYGIWLALNSYSGFIIFLDLGLFAVIPTNAVSQSHENLTTSERLSLSAMRGYSILVSLISISSLLTILIIGRIVNSGLLQSDFFLYVVLSSINVSLIFLLRYFEASFRSVNSTYGFAILTLHSVVTSACTILILVLKGDILNILVSNLIISILFLAQFLIKGDAYHYERISIREIYEVVRNFAKNGLTYQLFPIGYLVINQGIIITIQHAGSFEDVGTLGAIRLVAGIFRQISTVFVASSIPQIALLLKAKNFKDAEHSFMKIKRIVYGINSIILFALLFFLVGFFFLENSSIHQIPVLTCLFFVMSAAFDVPWNIWVSLPISTNAHGNLGVRFISSSVLTLASTVPLYKLLGLQGIALALLMQSLIMTRQAIQQGRRILESA